MILIKKSIFFLIYLIQFSCFASSINLDFEKNKDAPSANWKTVGNTQSYSLKMDNSQSYEGSSSASIEYLDGKKGFSAWSYSIPAIYSGSKLTLKGYIKTENVTEGWAGLWVKIDPKLSFNNMNKNGVKGTRSWQQYEITVDLSSEKAKNITVGGILVGKGKMWLDNLEIYIDGLPISKASLKKALPALQDKAFDEGSNLNRAALQSSSVDDLALLGKIWGFLKYHHPNITNGNFNWDYELFRFLPTYIKSNSNRDTALIKWIDSFGSVKPCPDCKKVSESYYIQPDFSWLAHHNISKKLRDKLEHIKANRHQGKQYYVDMLPAGNPDFKNENSYEHMPFPDEGFRLLSLYRYWNIIQYYYPYKYLLKKDWNNVLATYLPKFINVKNELEYEYAVLHLINEIHDTHANLSKGGDKIHLSKGRYYPPFHVQFVEKKLVIVDFYTSDKTENALMAKAIGLKIGDVITSINDQDIPTLIKQRLSFYPASNYTTKLRNLARELLRSNKKTIKISFVRNDKEETKHLKLYNPDELDMFYLYRKEPLEKSYSWITNDIGYVTLKNIKKNDIKKIKSEFINSKGLIIDIRNYPSTFVPFSLGGFFTENTPPFVKFTNFSLNTPGEFRFTEPLKIPSDDPNYQGKLIILVNEITQSSAEYTAMAFKAGKNTTVLGSTTAGADGNVSKIYLPGGLLTMISGIGVYYPDGSKTQQVGIIPDIEVSPTIVAIKSGKDELLEKAIDVINDN